MFLEERHIEISDKIQLCGKITIQEITEKYGISDESARRDLRILEKQGLCKRTRGGAIKESQINKRPPPDRDFEKMQIFENYKAIAQASVNLLKENDTVFITSGSFGHIMLSLLPKDIHYTVVVNSVDMGKALRAFENVDAYVIGGKMRGSGSFVDSFALDFVKKLHFDSCFVTGAGLTADFGLSNGTDETAAFQRAVICNSRKKYLLMPGVKVGKNAFVKVCDADAFDEIITDWDCVEDQISAFNEKGIKVTAVVEQNG